MKTLETLYKENPLAACRLALRKTARVPEEDDDVLVHGRYSPALKTYPADLVRTIRDVAKLIDRLPGDPGASCSLERRVEGVLRELQKRKAGA